MISPTAQPESIEADAKLRRQIKWVNIIGIGVLLLMIIGPVGLAWWYQQAYPTINTLSVTDFHPGGPTAVCPGDFLPVEYTFSAQGAGVLTRDYTVWSEVPPRTVIYSTSRRFILEGPITQDIVDGWHVPVTYVDPELDKIQPLPPGRYKRMMAISSPTNKALITIDSFSFTIREDCP